MDSTTISLHSYLLSTPPNHPHLLHGDSPNQHIRTSTRPPVHASTRPRSTAFHEHSNRDHMPSTPSSTSSSLTPDHARPSLEERRSSTPEPFTDPNPHSDSTRQKVAQIVSLPLAAAGGVVLEVAQKVKELVTGESTKIDTSKKHPEATLSKE